MGLQETGAFGSSGVSFQLCGLEDGVACEPSSLRVDGVSVKAEGYK